MFSFTTCFVLLVIFTIVGYWDNWRRSHGGPNISLSPAKIAAIMVIIAILSFPILTALGRGYMLFQWSLAFQFYYCFWGLAVMVGVALLIAAVVVLLQD
jgi:H+/Cl- antiporter ClcA